MSISRPILLVTALTLAALTRDSGAGSHAGSAPGREGDDARRHAEPHTLGDWMSANGLFLAVPTQQPEAPETRAQTPALGADSSFARIIERLSEPGGYFDSDNLISNEASYLHVVGKLERMGVRGGAYIGVGPDQNFSYIARIRPNIAFIIDIRRDNLLQHILLKSLFAHARNRVEYLCLLFGKPVPPNVAAWDGRTLDEILAYIDATPSDSLVFKRTLRRIADTALGFGYALSDPDLSTIRRFHTAFYDAGPALRFTSYGRSPRAYYPTYRQLLLETDLEGRRGSYLVNEDDFQFLKTLQRRDRIIPVVGDLAGEHALAAIGDFLRGRKERVSAFYTSNVEFYLMANGTFDQYARNVQRLPHDAKSVIIRSYFGRYYPHPQSVPGYSSTQLLHGISNFLEEDARGGYRSYADLVTRSMLDLRS